MRLPLRLGDRSLVEFDKQVADIYAARDAIGALFPAEHVVNVLDTNGVHVAYDELHKRIFTARPRMGRTT